MPLAITAAAAAMATTLHSPVRIDPQNLTLIPQQSEGKKGYMTEWMHGQKMKLNYKAAQLCGCAKPKWVWPCMKWVWLKALQYKIYILEFFPDFHSFTFQF